MKIHVDRDTDALYLRLDASRIVDSEEVRPGVVLDYDADDQVVGVEFLGISRRLSPEQLSSFELKLAS